MSGSALHIRLHVLAVPLRRPFTTALSRVTERRTVLIELLMGDIGWGEAAPYPGQDEDIEAMLDAARAGRVTPVLRAALDQARCDAEARADGRPLASEIVESLPMSVAIGIEGAVERVDHLVGEGVRAFKLKVAPGNLSDLVAIRERHEGIVLGVDGNGSFGDLDRHDLGLFADLQLAYAEELFRDWTTGGAEAFSDMTGVPLFADESVRSLDDVRRVLALPAVGGVTLKPGRLGWAGACEARDAAIAAGKRWRASGLLETGIGRAYTDILAAGPGATVSDVAPARMFLADDVAPDRRRQGHIVVPEGSGIGVTPDPQALERLTVDRLDVDLGGDA